MDGVGPSDLIVPLLGDFIDDSSRLAYPADDGLQMFLHGRFSLVEIAGISQVVAEIKPLGDKIGPINP
jgi:hypothetical protein